MKATSIILSSQLLALGVGSAANLVVNWSTSPDPIRALRDYHSIPLRAGTPETGDGTLVQLGYYGSATSSNPFSGTWITLASTTMGDGAGGVDGRFSSSSVLTSGSFVPPSPGTALSIRFFDGTTAETSSHYNAVSNRAGAWNYQEPGDSSPTIDMILEKDLDIVFRSAPGGQFQTQILVPEPSNNPLVLAALSLPLWRRCRQTRVPQAARPPIP